MLLIDESYNANLASMAATLKSLGEERDVARRIAVLGPMRELGERSGELHAGLAPSVRDARGPAHPDRRRDASAGGKNRRPHPPGPCDERRRGDGGSAPHGQTFQDAILVKASNSVGLAKLVESMAKELACST